MQFFKKKKIHLSKILPKWTFIIITNCTFLHCLKPKPIWVCIQIWVESHLLHFQVTHILSHIYKKSAGPHFKSPSESKSGRGLRMCSQWKFITLDRATLVKLEALSVTVHLAVYDKGFFLLPRLNRAGTSRLLHQCSAWSLLVRFILDCSLAPF